MLPKYYANVCQEQDVEYSNYDEFEVKFGSQENYEIIKPEDVGLKSSSIDLTARSGRAALRHRLKLLGFSFSNVELETIYIRFIEMADEKKLLHDEDLYKLMK